MKRSGIRDGPPGFHCATSGLRVLKILKALPVAVVAPLLSGLSMYWPTVPWMRRYPGTLLSESRVRCAHAEGPRVLPSGHREPDAFIRVRTAKGAVRTLQELEFMQRLAALVPRPRLHVIRFHGLLAPSARLRPDIIPNVPVNANTPSADHAAPAAPAPPHELAPAAHKTARSGFERRTPARRAKARRAFVNGCSRRYGTLLPVRWHLEDHRRHRTPPVITKIPHLGLPARAPPRAAARAFDRFELA